MLQKISKSLLVLILSLLTLLVFLSTFAYWLYSAPLTPKKKQVLGAFSLPVAKVGNRIIYSQEVLERQSLVLALGKKIELAEALQLIIDDSKKVVLLKKNGIKLNSELSATLINQLEKQENKNFQDKIQKSGITRDEYRNKILAPYQNLFALKLFYNSINFHKAEYKVAEEIRSSLEKNEDVFLVLSKYPKIFKDPRESSLKAETGYVSKDALLPEIQNVLSKTKVDTAEVVTTTQGVVILKLLGTLPASQATQEMVNLKIVSYSLKGFEDWLRKNSSDIPVNYFLKY